MQGSGVVEGLVAGPGGGSTPTAGGHQGDQNTFVSYHSTGSPDTGHRSNMALRDTGHSSLEQPSTLGRVMMLGEFRVVGLRIDSYTSLAQVLARE